VSVAPLVNWSTNAMRSLHLSGDSNRSTTETDRMAFRVEGLGVESTAGSGLSIAISEIVTMANHSYSTHFGATHLCANASLVPTVHFALFLAT
jgi:hypothetical protein